MPSPKGPLMTEPAFVLPLRYSFEFPVPEIQRRDYSFQEVNVLSLETIPERGQNACLLEEVCLTALSTSGDLFLTKRSVCPRSGMLSCLSRPFQNGGKVLAC